MSEEETRPDALDTAGEGPASDAPSEQPVDSAAVVAIAAANAGSDPMISDPGEQAGFAAAVLGDTLPSAVRSAVHADAHGHGHGAHGDDHFAHTLPMKMLIGVLGALVILTVLTVAVTSVDLGSQGNFIIAMIIATIKAALVMGYFMHLVWDSKFNVFAFLSSFLFVLLFLSMTLLDRGEYQSGIDRFEIDQKTTK